MLRFALDSMIARTHALLEPWAELERQSGRQGLRFLEVGLWVDVRLRAACEPLGPFQ